MITNMAASESGDKLNRWWSPIEWLSIVYGVWFDQKWYWQTVRPRIEKRWWLVLIQALLGSALVAACLALLWGYALYFAGKTFDWGQLVRFTIATIVGEFMLSVAAGGIDFSAVGQNFSGKDPMKADLSRRTARFVPIAVTLITVGGFTPLVYALSGLEGGWPHLWDSLTFLGIVLAGWGAAVGVGFTVAYGSFPRLIYAGLGGAGILTAVVFAFDRSEATMTPLGKVFFPLFIAGYLALIWFLAERWASRQVPEKFMRQKMARKE